MRQLEILADRFDASVEALPEIRREALERAGRGLLSTVREIGRASCRERV